MSTKNQLRVAELFAGVGGFRLGLEAASCDFVTRFSSQWEPPGTPRRQFASACYAKKQFAETVGAEHHYNEDIAEVLNRFESGELKLSPIDMVVGGFPCQDYSVAKPLNQSAGLEGKKGVLWWQIRRLLELQKKRYRGGAPRWVLLENVDRLLKSPASQRGRDFAIMLASLSELGYDIEWRVINAADYGFPQRRRRVFIVGRRRTRRKIDEYSSVTRDGILAKAFAIKSATNCRQFELPKDLYDITRQFGVGDKQSQFLNAGIVRGTSVFTCRVDAEKADPMLLSDVLVDESMVGEEYFVDLASLPKWEDAKGSKSIERVHKLSGASYRYKEGGLPLPDPLNRPARTVLTSEGGSSPSRSKHIVRVPGSRYRRLLPVELERLNGFPDNWTDTDMTPAQRAFCMGNALVVGVVERIARQIARVEGLSENPESPLRKW